MATVKFYKIGADALPTESESTDDLFINSIDLAASMNAGNIQVSANAIISTDTNGDLALTPNGTGDLILDGVNWPQADGSSGQFLQTNGAGQSSWANPSAVATIDTANYVAGAAGVTARDAVYISAAGTVLPGDADAIATSRIIGMATNTDTVGNPISVQYNGVLAGFTGLTAGAKQYLDTATAGGRTETAPSGAADCIIQLGFAASTTELDIQVLPLLIRT